jgi:hypothetical protein
MYFNKKSFRDKGKKKRKKRFLCLGPGRMKIITSLPLVIRLISSRNEWKEKVWLVTGGHQPGNPAWWLVSLASYWLLVVGYRRKPVRKPLGEMTRRMCAGLPAPGNYHQQYLRPPARVSHSVPRVGWLPGPRGDSGGRNILLFNFDGAGQSDLDFP